MKDVIRWKDHYYILASSSLADGRTEVLKQGETFAVFDRYGDVYRVLPSPQGLYHEGTRFLSQFELSLGTQRLMMLSASVKEDNALFTADFSNSDMMLEGQRHVPRGTLHLSRTRFLWQGTWHERIRVHNYGTTRLPLVITIGLDADFADLFEARGRTRPRRGVRLKTVRSKTGLVFGYKGLDKTIRRTSVRCSPPPKLVMADGLKIETRIPPHGDLTWDIAVSCEIEQRRNRVCLPYDRAQHEAEHALQEARASDAHVYTANEQFNHWLNRSLADLHMLISDTPHGLYPYAGVPWFSVPFGRDGIITALQMLWMNPGVARGVLGFLAATQATEARPEQDAEVGKILHETRQGEMAALGEIPFGRYYGSVDATPLFVVLAGAYYERSGDRAFLATLWPHIQRALEWIDQCGDPAGHRVHHLCETVGQGPCASRVERFTRFCFSCRRDGRGGAGCAVRGPGVRVSSKTSGGGSGTDPWGQRAGRSVAERGGLTSGTIRAGVLVRRTRLLRPCVGRAGTAVPCAFLECGALPVWRYRRAGAWPSERAHTLGRGIFSADGASAQLRQRRHATTRCRTIMGRCGLTTTPSLRPAWRHTETSKEL